MRSLALLLVLCSSPLGILGWERLEHRTYVNNGKRILCNRAKVEEVRIKDCKREPCRVEKGEEIPVEIDFSFQQPRSTNDVELVAFAPYWSIPGGTNDFGSNVVHAKSCSALRIRPCPAPSERRLTLKTVIYADPELRKTVGVENGGDNASGEVTTAWSLKFLGRHETRSSDCTFTVRLELIDDPSDVGRRILSYT